MEAKLFCKLSLIYLCFINIFFCSMVAHGSNSEKNFYSNQMAWQAIQTFLPERLHLSGNSLPDEDWWEWNGHQIHLDYFKNPNAPALVILLHGVGTNGRQLSMIAGGPLAKEGYEVIALDLPGYGMTQINKKEKITYDSWVELVSDFINAQKSKNDRPIFLYGLSAGGMLAYHSAALNGKVSGIIGMTFLDQREKNVRHKTASNSFISITGSPFLRMGNNPLTGGIKFPLRLVSKMNTLVNDDDALEIFLKDKTSAGNWVSVRFLDSYLRYQPVVEPEDFTICPVLLTQPAKDQWTPIELSLPFLHRLPPKIWNRVFLENAGHYPLEDPGLEQMENQMLLFIQKTLAT